MAFGPFLLLALMEGLVTAAVLALAASGLSLVFGVMRVVNVAHGEFYMLGAVLAWVVTTMIPGPPALAFVAALLIAPLIVATLAALANPLTGAPNTAVMIPTSISPGRPSTRPATSEPSTSLLYFGLASCTDQGPSMPDRDALPSTVSAAPCGGEA